MKALLVRHAEASGQERDAGLTARGVGQAQELADALRGEPIARVVSSPFRRARQTAEALAGRREVYIDARLAEWQLPWIPPTEWPEALRAILTGDSPLPPGAEPAGVARARGLAALRDAMTSTDGVAALVTHGKLLALVLSELQKIGAFEAFKSLRNPHVFEARTSGARLEVRSLWFPRD